MTKIDGNYLPMIFLLLKTTFMKDTYDSLTSSASLFWKVNHSMMIATQYSCISFSWNFSFYSPDTSTQRGNQKKGQNWRNEKKKEIRKIFAVFLQIFWSLLLIIIIFFSFNQSVTNWFWFSVMPFESINSKLHVIS